MSALLLDIDQQVGIVTLNRPDKHNAFDDALILELTQALRDLDANPAVRVVVLSGMGKSFSAGADLNWMKRISEYSEEQNFTDAQALAELMRTLHGLSKPTVARVHGAAFGGGVGLIACCDIAVASAAANFSLSEVRIGLIPAVISPYVIAAMGERAARRYFLTGERFDAAEAYRIGLIHDHAPDDDMMDRTINLIVEALLSAGPNAQREAKALIDAVVNRPLSPALIEDTARRIAQVRVSTEGQEGLGAFIAKRSPAWIANKE
ncbi:MAG: enoyl-CoA hydratase/isomerase family protein [Betaproteobacteria bacterium]|nr:enoyl-CoA hydratase/isomerase family protein [Betaproteobacteria bacterium]